MIPIVTSCWAFNHKILLKQHQVGGHRVHWSPRTSVYRTQSPPTWCCF